jgi:hypothetical protein
MGSLAENKEHLSDLAKALGKLLTQAYEKAGFRRSRKPHS